MKNIYRVNIKFESQYDIAFLLKLDIVCTNCNFVESLMYIDNDFRIISTITKVHASFHRTSEQKN